MQTSVDHAADSKPGKRCVVLTLGRLPVALELARGFHALGWRVLVAEPFSMHLCRMSRSTDRSFTLAPPAQQPDRYLSQLQRLAQREQADLIVPVSEETMHVAALRDVSSFEVPVFVPPQGQVLELHDKYRFNQLAGRLGLAVPESALASAPEAAGLVASGPSVFKPRFTCSGRGIRFLQPGDSYPGGNHALVQRRITGRLVSSFSLARQGQLMTTAVYRAAISSGSVSVCFQRQRGEHAVEQWVEQFVSATAHDGFIAFDFMVDGSGTPYALECNPRVTSGIHFFEPVSLVRSLLSRPGRPITPQFRPEQLMAESWSAFTTCLGSLLPGRRIPGAWSQLAAARDVSWSPRDPWPFLLGVVNTAPLITRAILRRQTFAEVAALDLEWRDDPSDAKSHA